MAPRDERGRGSRARGANHRTRGMDQGASPPASANRRRRLILVVVGLVGVLSLAAVVGLSTFRAARFRARLPSLLAWSREPATLRARLVEVDRAARVAPTSTDAVGTLGFAYHANLF